MYGDYKITLYDEVMETLEEWAFQNVLIDYSRRGIAVINKQNKVVFFITPSRDVTVTVEAMDTSSSHITRS